MAAVVETINKAGHDDRPINFHGVPDGMSSLRRSLCEGHHPYASRGKSIRCSACGDYDISVSVCDLDALQSLNPEQRLEALNRAKRFSAPNKRPVITSYDI